MTILFSDNFIRANSTSLGANYAPNAFDGNANGLGISSDFCLPVNGGGTQDASNVCTAVGTLNDGYAEITLADSASSSLGSGMGVTWRDTTASLTHYRLIANANGWELAWFSSGSFNLIQNSSATTFAAGDRARLSFTGTTWTVLKNGVSLASSTDSHIASGTPGICFSSTDASTASLYEVGTVGGGGNTTITPTQGSDTLSGNTPTVTAAQNTVIQPIVARRSFQSERGVLMPSRKIFLPTRRAA